MNIGELISIKTLEDEQSFFGDTEKHTPYRDEVRMFSCVQQGDISKLIKAFKDINTTVTTGKMSNDDVTQYKYMAVSTVTLATRYAIQGGLNEKVAYDFSDNMIMLVDSLNSKEAILGCLATQIIKLTKMVRKSKTAPIQSPHVKKCIFYINENICSKITVYKLADICNISPDYLSQIFKDEMGENLSSYILRIKLEKSKELLMQGKSISEICETLGFSSQSHFTTSFKKHYGMTPKEFINITK
jgi:AraC-like DNA-binding protein/ribosomal protein S25